MARKVLVVGGSGLVGNALIRSFSAEGWEVSATTLRGAPVPPFSRLDIRDAAAVRALIGKLKPSWVAVPAANPFVDYCELHAEETRAVNVAGTLAVLAACREAGARMAFFSSDYVFDGSRGPYRETDAVSPLNEYGRQKAAVEAEMLKDGDRHLIARTSGAYGWQAEPKNFVLQVRAKLMAGEPIKVARDLSYNPTWSDDLAGAVSALAAKGRGGVFHVAGPERVNRLDFARLVAAAFGLDARGLVPVSSSEFKAAARRPEDSSLATDKVRAAAGRSLLGPRDGLAAMAASESAWRGFAAESLPSAQ